MTERLLPRIGLLLLGLLLGAGLLALLLHRFRQGDVYPPYSTYRNDPQGAAVFYAALGGIPGVETSRNLRPLSRLGEGRQAALFFLGLSEADIATATEDESDDLKKFVREGGRLVLAFQSRDAEPKKKDEKPKQAEKKEPSDKPQESAEEKNDPETKPEKKKDAPPAFSFFREWGFALGTVPVEKAASSGETPPETGEAREAIRADDVSDAPALPAALLWHGDFAFEKAAPAWRVLYRIGDRPVCLERRLGLGTVVLLADSVPFGNEALVRQPEPGLLSWTVGSARRIVFDETNHGIAEHPGVASLARRYHLGGFLAGLAVLLALFLWRSLAGFLPASVEEARGDLPVPGRDSLTGLANLLGSRLSTRSLLAACLDEWEGAVGKPSQNPDAARRLAQARARLDAETARDPAATYRDLSAVLNPPTENLWKTR